MRLYVARAAICAAILLCNCSTLSSNSQDSARTVSITIEVRDSLGGRIPGAEITVVPSPPDLQGIQATDSAGQLSLRLPAGSYDLNVRSPGFHKTAKHIDVQQGVDQKIEIVLQVASSGPGIVVDRLWPTEHAPAGDLVAPAYVVLPNPKLLGCEAVACLQLWLNTNAAPGAKYPKQLVIDFSDGSTITTPNGSIFQFPRASPYGLTALYDKSVTIQDLADAINERYAKWVYGDPTPHLKLWRVEPEKFVIQLSTHKDGPRVIYLPIGAKSLPYKNRQ